MKRAEMAKKSGEILLWISADLCKGTEDCGLCIDVCEEDTLGVSPLLSPKGVHLAEVVHAETCTGCELCVLHCPELATGMVRSPVAAPAE